MDQDALMALAERLAGAAAAAILAVRAAGFVVERKRDHSPVTVADRVAEALIVEGLRQAAPAIPVVAEEAHEAGALAVPAGMFWLVDPLDGTRDFAAGHDSFAVNIGLVAEGRPVLGAVALPAHGEVFAGIVGRGAWKSDAAGRRPIAVRPVPASGAVAMVSRQHDRDPRIGDFLAARGVARVVSLGSAEKLCRVAEGAADLYPSRGPTMEWDTAAPEAVLRAAGGAMADWEGAPLRYGKAGWRNPGFLATGRA
ncbi:3'(2'),5'-bisphosphate nucleotidase CysQ [Falsiroseomonas selenitidurans]|uniref:3'(2'),5'-bisphosphate nucleotidase CysQ n=1 Tax=Falsiroseomonas selenitidurans TaxID=2716335 RepID=A0ABX1EA37_9PROT|nr:3'(2'),5'-bisphosphate nucleotidase CysQ [Falsiroseomonas selenitidurans]NKC31795.1 3'(2'),5'-bisphosphate nucleotidase CysQ [Falsiroseomonas selenitidurans]